MQTPLTCSGHTRPVVDLSFSEITEYGYFLISASKDSKPMLRQGDTGDWVGTFEGHKGAVWAATLNADATRAATGSADYTAKVWDAVSGSELQTFTHKHIVKSVAFSPTDNLLLTGGFEKFMRIYDLNKPDGDAQEIRGHTGYMSKSLWMPNGKTIVSIADDKTIRFWDKTSLSEIKSIELPAKPTDLELSKDGKLLTVTYGALVTFWDVDKFELVKQFEIATKVNSASLHPEKAYFVCGGDDFKTYKCDFETGQEIESFKGHFGPVHTMRFSPDGELYASGSEDGTLRLWQTTVGKTYGLWKCILPEDISENNVAGAQKVET